MRNRAVVALAVLASLGVALVGCSSSANPTPTNPTPSFFVGKTLQNAYAHSPGSVSYRDASKTLGVPVASPNPEAAEQTVVAACYRNDTQLNVMVIPSDRLTKSITDNAKQGKYDSLLDDCEK